MKKFLVIFFILFINVLKAETITDFTYKPKKNEYLSILNFESINISKEHKKSSNFIVDQKYSLNDKVNFNYGFTFNNKKEYSSDFEEVYYGINGRILSTENNKLEVILLAGEKNNLLTSNNYLDYGFKYGLNFEFYKFGAKFLTKHNFKKNNINFNVNARNDFLFLIKNNFIVTEKIEIGLDFLFNYINKYKINQESVNNCLSFGTNFNLKYLLNKNNAISLYIQRTQNKTNGRKNFENGVGLSFYTLFGSI